MKKTFMAGLLSLFVAGSVAAETTELTVSSWLPHSHALVADFIQPWSEEVEKQTEGRVKMRLLTKPVTNPQGHFDAVRNGLADITFISHAYYPGRFDLVRFAVFPFSGDTATARSVAAWRVYDKYFASQDEHKGVKLLGIYTHGPGMAFTTDKKIETIDDFSGLKIRVGGGMAADVAKSLGASVVAKPAPESYELLSTGVVDGVFFPAESINAFKLDGVIDYVTQWKGGLYSDSHGVIMNQDAFDKLSDQDKAIIDKLSGEYLARLAGQAWDKHDAAATSLIEEKITITQADDELTEQVRERTQHLRDSWADKVKKAGLDPDEILAEFEKEITANES